MLVVPHTTVGIIHGSKTHTPTGNQPNGLYVAVEGIPRMKHHRRKQSRWVRNASAVLNYDTTHSEYHSQQTNASAPAQKQSHTNKTHLGLLQWWISMPQLRQTTYCPGFPFGKTKGGQEGFGRTIQEINYFILYYTVSRALL